MTYEWKVDFGCKVNAQTAGEFCAQLENTVGLTAENLLNASRSEDAVMHNAFEWDNDVASEKWRTHQARTIIKNLAINVNVGESVEPIRAFFSTEEMKYESLEVIMKNEDKKADLLETALKELQSFRNKYSQLTELSKVFEEIDRLRG